MEHTKKIDAVFEGGGVKGSALVGAVAAAEALGYKFENLAGTSAGAIIASLLAAGYRASDLDRIMTELDYRALKDPTMLTKVPLVGGALSLLIRKGIYKGDFFEQWLRGLFLEKNVRTFRDLVMKEYAHDPRYRYKLQAIASDITRGKLLVLPRDSADYGMNPDDLDVAFAVRMSMSIPYFYEPVRVGANGGGVYIVDGGILSNFPVWLFDDGSEDPAWPTIGFKLVDPDEGAPHKISGPITLFGALFETMLEAHDARYIKDADFMRTIPIPTLGVHTTDFNIDTARKRELYDSGRTAGEEFFKQWDFEAYKKKYRWRVPETRTTRVWAQD